MRIAQILGTSAISTFGPYLNSTGARTVPTDTAPNTAANIAPSTTLSTYTSISVGGNLTISTNGRCSGTQTCLGSQYGEWCSRWGYCGRNSSYSSNCQPDFGLPCNASATNRTSPSITTSIHTSSQAPLIVLPPILTSPQTSSLSSSYASIPSLAPSAVPYVTYFGTGEPSDGWPRQDQWRDLESLFEANKNIIATSCAQWHVPNNSGQETQELKQAIQRISKSCGVDERFIFAVVMQESNGCVRAPTTVYSVRNPGLMQSYEGTGTCNTGNAESLGKVSNPCPASEIHQMLKDGVTGTTTGSTSLVSALQQSRANDVSRYYKAARIYNSGAIAQSGNLQDGIATHCYASDVANRLLGWASASTECTLNSL